MHESSDNQLKLLSFSLADDRYLLPIESICEILRYTPVTPIPVMPNVIHGVINLRGYYLPVIDLSRRLAQKKTKIGEKSCIVVAESYEDEDVITLGLLVDEVNHFVDLDASKISDPPKFGHTVASEFIKGMIQLEKMNYLVLNTEKVLDLKDLVSLLDQLDSDEKLEYH
ncbi:MAG: chemotaxis protein CheW [Pseudomonadota bacterium]